MFYASRPLTDADAFSVSIPAVRAARIVHMVPDRQLMLFTEGGVYTVDGSDSEGFSYRTCTIRRVANAGACDVEPVAGLNTVLYIADDRRTLYEIRYDFAQDTLVPVDRSVLASHLTEASPIVRAAWQPYPDGILWTLLADGTLLSFTYLPEHEVFAWASHAIAGADLVTDLIATGAVDEAAEAETQSQLFAVAQSGAKTWLVRLRAPAATDNPPISAAACLDLAQTAVLATDAASLTPTHPYPAATAVRAVNLDTGTCYPLTSDGTDLDATATLPAGTYLLGTPIAAELRTLRPELPDRNIQGMRKNVADVLARLHRSRAISSAPLAEPGCTQQPAAPAPLDRHATVTNGRIPHRSGDAEVAPKGEINRDGRLSLTDDSCWPLEILCTVTAIDIESK
jgi:hypothetical protein